MRLVTLATVCLLAELALGAVLSGRFTNVPQELTAVNAPILNVNNYQSRITVELYELGEASYGRRVALVDEKWEFLFPDLEDGSYELMVQSVDFTLKEERYRIGISDNKIIAHEDPLWDEFRNTTIAVNVNEKNPLEIEMVDLKQYYEDRLGTLAQMVLDSPLGFIFKNRAYTIMFALMMLLAAFPYILGIVNPELAAEMREVQRGNLKPLETEEQPIDPSRAEKAVPASFVKNRKSKKN